MELNYKSFGHGKPVVILHGLFGMLDNWMTIGKELASNYSVYLVDLRNHGRSPHTEEHSYALMAEDLAEFLEQQRLHHASIIGHSMGGKVAMQFALEHPNVVDKLVVVDIAPKSYPPQHDMVIESLLSFDPAKAANRREMLLQLQSHLHDARTVSFLMKNLSRVKEGGFRWKMNLETLVSNYHEINNAITSEDPFNGSTMFIRGSDSGYVSNDDWDNISLVFPEAKLLTVNRAGHWVHADQPGTLLAALKAFLG